VIEPEGHRLAEWATRFQSLGLLMTAPRRAILVAMSASNAPRDAVTLLLAARVHHAATSLGTVYRLLRELEHCGLAVAHAHPHKRLQWRLAEPLQVDISREHPSPGDLQRMQEQMQGFLRDLEKMGLTQQHIDRAERQLDAGEIRATTASTFDVLRSIAGRLGYRFA
jgi:hypothetical protein